MTAGFVDGSAPRYELLGPLRARLGGRDLDLGPADQRAVLAVLLLNANRPVQAAQVIDAVWGAKRPANAANLVQDYITSLRRALDSPFSPRSSGELLTRTDAGYQLQVSPGGLDTDEFEALLAQARAARAEGRLADATTALDAALAMFRSTPLAGLTGPYFDASRDQLIERRAAAQESWAEVALERGQHALVATELGGLVGEDSRHEGLRALLMLALYRSGRQADALTVYQDERAFLKAEFGDEPGERLQQMQQRILRFDPSLALPAPVDSMSHAGRPADGSAGARIAALGGAAPTITRAHEPPRPAQPTPPHGSSAGPARPADPVRTHRPELPALLRAGLPAPRRLWIEIGLSLLVTAASLGLLAWVALAYFGVRRRNWAQLVAAGVYVAAIVVGLASSGSDAGDVTFGAALLVAVVIGPINVIASCVIYLAMATDEAERRTIEEYDAALRRSLARDLLEQQSPLAHGLHIGRPDLPRHFHDGGLVDINSVPAKVLAGLPGVGGELAARIVDDRSARGAFATVDDLVQRTLLPADVVRRLDDYLVAG